MGAFFHSLRQYFLSLSRRKINVLFFAVLSCVLFFIYYPSFFHIPRRDQIWWLMEMGGYEGFWDVFVNTYSWSRTRVIFVGDEYLFRPLLFGHLALFKSLFGLNSFWWQVFGVFLHGIIVGLMLRILSRVTTSLWVHFALFCGACLFVATPLVIWPHIHGYLLAMIFILAAFERFLVYQEKGQDKDLSWMALFLTVGSFFYEFGVVFSGIGFGWTMWETWRKKIEWNGRGRKLALAYLIPICVYLTVNFVDFLWHRATIQSLDSYTVHLTAFLSLAGFLKFMDQCLAVIGTFFMATFFPVFLDIQMEMNPRIMLPEVAGFIRKIPYFYNAGNVLAFMSLAGFLIFQLFRKKISNRDGHPTESSLSKQAAFSIFCFSVVMFFAYVVSITAGRLFVSGMDYLDRSYYYFYFLFVFAFLACVSGCCMMRSCGKAFPIPLWVRISLVLSGLLLVIVNGVFVRAYNLGLEKMFAGEYDYMLDLESFVREHRAEPDFSFQMIYRSADDRIKIVVGKDKKVMDVNANDMIFSRYVDFKNPKYHLVYRDGRLNVFLTKEQAFEFLNDVKAGVL